MTISEQRAHRDRTLFDELHLFLQRSLPLLPPDISPAWLSAVLDVGCGLNQWGRDLYRTMIEQAGADLLTEVRIEGIDQHLDAVRLANQRMRASNAHVTAFVGDMFHLPAETRKRYDLVHARLLGPYVAPQSWPALLDELVRACKPGGWLVWCEPAMPTSGETSPGWNQWLDWIEQAILATGGSPHVALSMEQIVGQIDALHEVTLQKTMIPLQKPALKQGCLTIEQVACLRDKLLPIQFFLLEAGVAPSHLLEQGRGQVEDELTRRVVSSQWEWSTLSGRVV